MKRFSFLFYLLLLSNTLTAQELYIGAGLVVAEQYYNNTIIDLDSIVVYEDNLYKGLQLNPPSIRLELPLSMRLHVAVGLQYKKNFFDLSTYKKTSSPLGPASKGTVVGLPTIEVPLSAFYNFSTSKAIHVRAFGGVMLAYNGIRFKGDYEGDPHSEDFPPSIAHVLNQAGTVPKRAYTNYFYGINIMYKRFGLDVYRVNTLSRNLNNNFKIWSSEHTFNRRSKSLRLAITYKLWKK